MSELSNRVLPNHHHLSKFVEFEFNYNPKPATKSIEEENDKKTKEINVDKYDSDEEVNETSRDLFKGQTSFYDLPSPWLPGEEELLSPVVTTTISDVSDTPVEANVENNLKIDPIPAGIHADVAAQLQITPKKVTPPKESPPEKPKKEKFCPC